MPKLFINLLVKNSTIFVNIKTRNWENWVDFIEEEVKNAPKR